MKFIMTMSRKTGECRCLPVWTAQETGRTGDYGRLAEVSPSLIRNLAPDDTANNDQSLLSANLVWESTIFEAADAPVGVGADGSPVSEVQPPDTLESYAVVWKGSTETEFYFKFQLSFTDPNAPAEDQTGGDVTA